MARGWRPCEWVPREASDSNASLLCFACSLLSVASDNAPLLPLKHTQRTERGEWGPEGWRISSFGSGQWRTLLEIRIREAKLCRICLCCLYCFSSSWVPVPMWPHYIGSYMAWIGFQLQQWFVKLWHCISFQEFSFSTIILIVVLMLIQLHEKMYN